MQCKRWAVVTGTVSLALALPLALAVPASAEVSGPCTGTIRGVDVATRSSTKKSDAIVVDKTETLVVGATTASGRLDRYKIQLGFAGRDWTVAKGSADGSSWTKTVNVKDYARYGVGYYKVSGVSSGGVNCKGAVLVQIKGSPFGSIAGIAGAALSIIGIGATAMNGIRGFKCGNGPGVVRSTLTDPAQPVQRYIADIKNPRDYVNTVQAICTYNPSRYPPLVAEVCGTFRPAIERICLWG